VKNIVFAGGCFWGIQAYFDGKKGVLKTKVGYANGNGKNPSYEEVCSGNTGFAEACFLEYDPRIVELEELLGMYWKVIDPTLVDRQGNDRGNQYRTGIYYVDEDDVNIIKKSIEDQQKNYTERIVTEVLPLENFYDAEEYHQKYLEKNPGGYCHIPKELMN
jgi:peptide-methionine (S)-S-oxide reductase